MNKMIAAAAIAATAALAPAFAQAQDTAAPTGAYVNLGAAYTDGQDVNLGSLQAKLGYRFHPNFGVEAEGAFGVDDDKTAGVNVKLKHQFAAYAIGFLPVAPNADLFARVGYGTTRLRASAAGVSVSDSNESVNLGVGGQYSFDGLNGIRVEYLYSDYDNGGGHASTFGVSYVRRF